MTSLADLKALAEKIATPPYRATDAELDAFKEATSPERVVALVAVAQAAQELVADKPSEVVGLPTQWVPLMAALAALGGER